MTETTPDIRAAIGLVRRQFPLIVAIFLAAIGLAGIAVAILPPVYSATALVLVDPARAQLLDPEIVSQVSDNGRIDSEVEILRSDAMLVEVDRRLVAEGYGPAEPGGRVASLVRLAGWDWEPEPEVDPLLALSRALTIERRGATHIIAISARASSPDRAAVIANTLSQSYIDGQLATKGEAIFATSEVVERRISRARQALAVAQERLDEASSVQPDQTYALVQARTLAQDQYQTLLVQQSQLDVQAELQLADARIVSHARAPIHPAFPDPVLIVALSGLAGLGLGLGAAYIKENHLGGFASPEQVSAVLRVPVMARIPREKHAGRTLADLLIDAPLSSYAEAIRRMRAGLERMVPDRSHTPVIMIASASAGDGKTTLALALARAYGLAGQKTLLIDADLRNPSIHTHLGLSPRSGLLEFLTGMVSPKALGSIVTQDDASSISVLSGAHHADTPTDQMITSRAFSDLIAAARANFDVIIIDTPPANTVVDASYIAGHAEVVAFVVGWSLTGQGEARSALGQISAAMKSDARIAAILNGDGAVPQGYRGIGRAYRYAR